MIGFDAVSWLTTQRPKRHIPTLFLTILLLTVPGVSPAVSTPLTGSNPRQALAEPTSFSFEANLPAVPSESDTRESATSAPKNVETNAVEAGETQCRTTSFNATRHHVNSTIAISGIQRVAGSDRFATSAQTASILNLPSSGTVVIANGDNFPDALSVAPAAASVGAPILLSHRETLPAVVAEKLAGLSPAQIVIVGGSKTLSESVESQIQSISPQARIWRASGSDRYETSAKISQLFWPDSKAGTVPELFIASGEKFPDALAGAASAAHLDAPLLLVGNEGLSPQLSAEIERLMPRKITFLGLGISPSARQQCVNILSRAYPASSSRVSEVGGADRYVTSKLIADTYFPGAISSLIASGTNFPDALVAAPLAKAMAVPILLAANTECSPASRLEIYQNITNQLFLGGEAILPQGALTSECGTIVPQETAPPELGQLYGRTGDLASGQLAPGVQQQGDWLVFPIAWRGQPNGITCGPASMSMILGYFGAGRSSFDGQPLSISALSGRTYGYIGSGFSGGVAWGNMPVAMNRWLGIKPEYGYRDLAFPTGEQFQTAVHQSFYTGRPILVDTIETRRGPHYNGHRGWSSHILVVYKYNPKTGEVGFLDPGSTLRGYSRASNFTYPAHGSSASTSSEITAVAVTAWFTRNGGKRLFARE